MDDRQKWIVFLSVFGVFTLIALAAIGAMIGWLPNAPQGFKEWGWTVLFTDVVAAVLVVFRVQFAAREVDVFLNLTFTGRNPSEIDIRSCSYEIRDGGNTMCQQGDAAVHRQAGGWQCRLRLKSGTSGAEFARLTLICGDGSTLHVPNFNLMTHTVEVQ